MALRSGFRAQAAGLLASGSCAIHIPRLSLPQWRPANARGRLLVFTFGLPGIFVGMHLDICDLISPSVKDGLLPIAGERPADQRLWLEALRVLRLLAMPEAR